MAGKLFGIGVDADTKFKVNLLKKKMGFKTFNELVNYLLEQNDNAEKLKASTNWEGKTGLACPNCGHQLMQNKTEIWCPNKDCTEGFNKCFEELAFYHEHLSNLEEVEYCEECGIVVKDAFQGKGNGLVCGKCGETFCYDHLLMNENYGALICNECNETIKAEGV